jgi:hypothetical protein
VQKVYITFGNQEFTTIKLMRMGKQPQPPLLKGEKARNQTYSPFSKGGRGDFFWIMITQKESKTITGGCRCFVKQTVVF